MEIILYFNYYQNNTKIYEYINLIFKEIYLLKITAPTPAPY